MPRTHIEVISIAQDDLRAYVFQLMRTHGFHRSQSSHGHEYGSENLTMFCADLAGTRLRTFCSYSNLKAMSPRIDKAIK